MKVVCDSSGCCAIKHIRDFYGIYPNEELRSQQLKNITESEGHDEDQNTNEPRAYKNWIIGSDLPVIRTGKELLLAYIAQIKERRPQGMITINLVEERECDDDYCCEDCNGMTRQEWDRTHSYEITYSTYTTDMWDKILKREGFSRVDFINSNSGNRICHYTLIYDTEN